MHTTYSHPYELLKPVRLLAMDVDGVLTDGTLGFDNEGGEQKRFHVADGMGLTLLHLAGVETAWISGRASAAVERRARDLKIVRVAQQVRDKGRALSQMMALADLRPDEVAFIGDDVNDLLAFRVAGVRIAVANADASVSGEADIVTNHAGGMGAVREVCDAILCAKGLQSSVLDLYLASLKETASDGFSGQ